MIYLTAAFLGSLGAFSYALHRLTSLVTDERERASVERRELMQRVQAPEQAIAVQAQRDMDEWEPPKLHIPFDADKEFTDYVNGGPFDD